MNLVKCVASKLDERVYLLNYGRERKFQLIRNAIKPTVNHDHDQMAITLVIYGCDLIPSARGAGRLRSLAQSHYHLIGSAH